MAFQAPEFLEASFWARNRGRCLGLVVAAAVVIFGLLFFQSHRQGKAAAAWSALVDETGATKAHIELGGDVVGTPSEPWALFQNARSAFVEKDFQEALSFASRLESDFGDHVLNRDGQVQKLVEDIRAEIAWSEKHPSSSQNPDVDDAHSVTVQTTLGAIKIGLYPDQAPEAVKAFLDLTRNGGLDKGSFSEAQREQWIAFAPKPAADESGDEETPSDDEDETNETAEEGDAEPSKLAQGIVTDRNKLSHYAGSVSFLRGQPGAMKPNDAPRIAVYLVDTPYKDSQEVVFGRVLSGLETLSQASTRDVSEGTKLEEPLEIQGIDLGTALSNL